MTTTSDVGEYERNAKAAISAIRSAVSETLAGVEAKDVSKVTISKSSGSPNAFILSYDVRVPVRTETYQSVTTAWKSAVADGKLQLLLHRSAKDAGATFLNEARLSVPETTEISRAARSKMRSLGEQALLWMIAEVFCIALIASTIAYIVYAKKTASLLDCDASRERARSTDKHDSATFRVLPHNIV
jgi:hypothetical protein